MSAQIFPMLAVTDEVRQSSSTYQHPTTGTHPIKRMLQGDVVTRSVTCG